VTDQLGLGTPRRIAGNRPRSCWIFTTAANIFWEWGRALKGEQQAAQWVEPHLHLLRHGKEKSVLREIAGLSLPKAEAGQTVKREQGYFEGHRGRMNYAEAARRGWPIGSGAVESACRQKQCRFKRPGQFWTAKGMRHLCALDEARRNGHWLELWHSN